MKDNEKHQMEIIDKLKGMKLSGMAMEIAEQFNNSNEDLLSFEDRVEKIVNTEWELRYNKKFNRYLGKAKLRYPDASLDESIYEQNRQLDYVSIEKLSTCTWIEEGRNLLVTGVTGAGKSYCANALAINAIKQFKTVLYIKSNMLLNELESSRINGKYMEYLKYLNSLDLLIIDDFGLMELDLDKCRDLFEVIDTRESRKSMLVVSQLPVNKWYELFKDSTYADACLDRLIHRAYRLDFQGKNMRNPER